MSGRAAGRSRSRSPTSCRGPRSSRPTSRRARSTSRATTPPASASPSACRSTRPPKRRERRYDLVVANLPYVREDEWATLEPEITEHEPRGALVAGPDGLDAIRGLLRSPPDCAAIGLEVGAGQAAEVADLVAAAGFVQVEKRLDLGGIERVVAATR